MRLLASLAMMMTFSTGLTADMSQAPVFPRLSVATSHGDFVLELDGSRSPITVMNFVQYARAGHYDGTIFHRVIPDFMAQAGGYGEDFEERPTRQPIPNESGNGLSNERGTIAMARMKRPHSATSQFYINLADNESLDPSPSRWGYTVFGLVVEGMEVLDTIARIPTGAKGPFPTDVPQSNVIIKSIRVLDEPVAE